MDVVNHPPVTSPVLPPQARYFPGFSRERLEQFAADLANVKILLLDQDGVILDDRHLLDIAARSLIRLGVSLPQEQIIIEGKLRAPHSRIDLNIQFLAKRAGVDADLDTITRAMTEASDEVKVSHGGSLPEELCLPATQLKALKAQYGLGLVTSRSTQDVDRILSSFGIREDFDSIVPKERVKRSKPDPEGICIGKQEVALARGLTLDQVRCIYLGDMHTDMKAGVAAGIYCVGVIAPMDRPAANIAAEVLYESGAHIVLDHAAHMVDLTQIVKEALGS